MGKELPVELRELFEEEDRNIAKEEQRDGLTPSTQTDGEIAQQDAWFKGINEAIGKATMGRARRIKPLFRERKRTSKYKKKKD